MTNMKNTAGKSANDDDEYDDEDDDDDVDDVANDDEADDVDDDVDEELQTSAASGDRLPDRGQRKEDPHAVRHVP